MKSAFNKEVAAVFKLKRNEIERINEMALEITDIQKELQISDSVFVSELDDDEDKDRIFTVHEDEIKVEKVLTEKEVEALKQQELDRQIREQNANNDLTERALTEMMNNTLESKDEVERL